MEHKARFRFGVHTPSQLVGIWFSLWELPLFAGLYTEVVTESAEEYGRYMLPMGIGKDCFATLLQGVRPRLLILRARSITVRLDMQSAMLEMVAYEDAAVPVFALVKARIQGLNTVSEARIWPLRYDYRGLRWKLDATYWMETLCSAFQRGMPNSEIVYFVGEDARAHYGEPPTDAELCLLKAQDENGWILYDRANDRLLGAGSVPNVWETGIKNS